MKYFYAFVGVFIFIPTSLKPFSWAHPALEVRTSPADKQGVSSKNMLHKDEALVVFAGTVMTRDEVLSMPASYRPYVLQLDTDLWIGSQLPPTDSEISDYINHSCNPNTGIKGQIFLVARRTIMPDEEITFDYVMAVSEWIGMEPA